MVMRMQNCTTLFCRGTDDDGEVPAVVLTGRRGMSRVAYAMTMAVLVLARKRRLPKPGLDNSRVCRVYR